MSSCFFFLLSYAYSLGIFSYYFNFFIIILLYFLHVAYFCILREYSPNKMYFSATTTRFPSYATIDDHKVLIWFNLLRMRFLSRISRVRYSYLPIVKGLSNLF